MEVIFWGTRGSLPASVNAESIRQKMHSALEIVVEKGLDPGSDIEAFIETEFPFWIKGTYGTNTPCIEIRDGSDFVLCDAGTGLRDFGNHLLRTYGKTSPKDFHIFISHPHWDHIQGFPFFIPIYIEGNRITVYGCHEDIREALSIQQGPPFFPIDFKDLEAEIRFVALAPGKTYDIAGFRVTAKEQSHPGKSYGYRFERHGKKVVYSTDSEHKPESEEDSATFVEFFSRADLLIFDAQYSLADACTIKEDWGHSNNFIGVELAQRAGVKHLCLYHNEPVSSDEDLDKFLQDTRKLASLIKEGGPIRVSIAWDGMVIEV
ncbi:MAG: MBL fold metallo-hydrolase [Desulfobacteraceae bacterium]|nr:MBL fold metallo-hydrolase [Desulfobacteraceae bacterium]